MCIDLVFMVVGILFLVIGLLGTVVPVLPGAPLSWVGLLLTYFSSYTKMSLVVLIIMGILALFVSIADNIFPSLMTKKSGGSKAGTIGSVIGLVAGFFVGPVGIIVGPFAGALVGELIHDSSDFHRALTAAFGAFKGFLLGTGLKIIVSLGCIWVLIFSLMNK